MNEDRARNPATLLGGATISEKTPHTNPAPPERAILAGFPVLTGAEDTLDELALLADTAGAEVVGRVRQRREAVHPGNFLSKGKTEETRVLAEEVRAALLICDEELSPAQVRNLEKSLNLRVIDRTELILDIFSRRARTREAHLQVELAQLRYLLPRLTGMWGHLSRTGGGIGTRGPGETQLEVDRRRVRQKITLLQRHLEGVEVERRTQAKRRGESVRISLVGYTNAGKSTLFNRLTRSSVVEEDKLFATLDTTTRKLALPGGGNVLLSDTVGFIRKLPHHLVASFRATLREVESADLLLHVVDAAHPAREEQVQAVEEVLSSLLERDVPRLLVMNKSDLLTDDGELELLRRHPEGILLSARKERDREPLLARLSAELGAMRVPVRVECDPGRWPELLGLAGRAERVTEEHGGDRVRSEWRFDRRDLGKLHRAGFSVEVLDPFSAAD